MTVTRLRGATIIEVNDLSELQPDPPRHRHRYNWGGPAWLAKYSGKKKPPPEPREYCGCGARRPDGPINIVAYLDDVAAWVDAQPDKERIESDPDYAAARWAARK